MIIFKHQWLFGHNYDVRFFTELFKFLFYYLFQWFDRLTPCPSYIWHRLMHTNTSAPAATIRAALLGNEGYQTSIMTTRLFPVSRRSLFYQPTFRFIWYPSFFYLCRVHLPYSLFNHYYDIMSLDVFSNTYPPKHCSEVSNVILNKLKILTPCQEFHSLLSIYGHIIN